MCVLLNTCMAENNTAKMRKTTDTMKGRGEPCHLPSEVGP